MKTAAFYALFAVSAAVFFSATASAEDKADQSGPTATVVDKEQAPPYTYLQLAVDGETNWYAAPANTLTVGEQVIVPAGGLPMKDFYSKTLDRTFEMVYFVGAIESVDAKPQAAELPPDHPPIYTDSPDEKASVSFDFSGIEKPEGGKTVAEIHRESAALAGQNVVVRGKVMKVSDNILGRNWIHLQDGTGDALSHDLTITSKATAEVGATVTARGILAINRDFGAGYKYDVILEDAEIQAE
jgi:hypothetical protein